MYRWLLAAALSLPAAALAHVAGEAAPDRIMAMPPALQEQFARRVLAGRASARERLERTVDFVFDSRGLGMRYEDGATHTVEQSFATRRANCLGFTLLFLALAREAGLEAWPQAWEDTLSWHRSDGIVYRNNHVNVAVRVGPQIYTLDVARNAVVTRGRPQRLLPQGLLARYHNNLAVEAMQRGDLAAARRHMATALALDGAQASHWSNAGVLELHGGDHAAARVAYDKALAIDPENTNALFNRVNLARREGDRAGEDAFRARLTRAQQKDPFHHFLQAIDYELAGDFARAIAHYREATRLHRGDHRFHAALAGALEKSGDLDGARESLRRAATLSDGATRDAYRFRLRELRELREP